MPGKSDNEYTRDFFDRHEQFFVTVFTWEGADREAAIETVYQHWAILAAPLARDRRAARKALLEHLNYGHERLKNAELVSVGWHVPERQGEGVAGV